MDAMIQTQRMKNFELAVKLHINQILFEKGYISKQMYLQVKKESANLKFMECCS